MTTANKTAKKRVNALTGETAYRQLFEAIQSGELTPGTRLRESEVAAKFGISRTPVREALRRLETQGLLEHQPHRGMVIRELDHQNVTELYLMREVLEGTAAALAARHASGAEILTLRDMIAADRSKYINRSDQLARTNRLFHQALYRGAHNRYLLDMLDGLRSAMALLGPTTLSLPERAGHALDEHEAIIDAIERHDPEAAEAAARRHIQSAHRARLRLMFEVAADAG